MEVIDAKAYRRRGPVDCTRRGNESISSNIADSYSTNSVVNIVSDSEPLNSKFEHYVASRYYISLLSWERLDHRFSGVILGQGFPNLNQVWFEKMAEHGVPISPKTAGIIACCSQNTHPNIDEFSILIATLSGKIYNVLLFREARILGLDDCGVDHLLRYFPMPRQKIESKLSRMTSNAESNDSRPPDLLTPIQLNVIRWWVAGKTHKDIATILGKKRRTVRYHLNRVRELYGYSTIQQTAVRVAQDYKIDP